MANSTIMIELYFGGALAFAVQQCVLSLPRLYVGELTWIVLGSTAGVSSDVRRCPHAFLGLLKCSRSESELFRCWLRGKFSWSS